MVHHPSGARNADSIVGVTSVESENYSQITQITQKHLGRKTAKSKTLCGQCFFESG